MKKLLILICTLAISAAAFAAPAKTAAHMSGTIAKYDATTRTLTVKHDGNKETAFQLNDNSAVMKGKAKTDASSLSVSTGHSVKVEYVMEGATRAAEKIEVADAAGHTSMKKK